MICVSTFKIFHFHSRPLQLRIHDLTIVGCYLVVIETRLLKVKTIHHDQLKIIAKIMALCKVLNTEIFLYNVQKHPLSLLCTLT